MAQLNRDYNVIRHDYEELVQRRETASISGDIDASERLAEFRVVEPPRLNPAPLFPGRQAMIGIALLLSVAAGALCCYGATRIVPTICDACTLRSLTDRPMLGSVSLVQSEGLLLSERRQNVLFGVTVAALFALYGAWSLEVLLRTVAQP